MAEYNNVRSQLNTINRKQSGRYVTIVSLNWIKFLIFYNFRTSGIRQSSMGFMEHITCGCIVGGRPIDCLFSKITMLSINDPSHCIRN